MQVAILCKTFSILVPAAMGARTNCGSILADQQWLGCSQSVDIK